MTMPEKLTKQRLIPYFEELLLFVIDDVYKNNEYPIKADYEKAIINLFNEIHSDIKDFKPITRNSYHSQIWAVINNQIISKKLVQEGNFVFPNNQKRKKQAAIRNMQTSVSFKQNKLFPISSNTIAIALSEGSDMKFACDQFQAFFGENHCYNILTIDTTVIIMLHNYDSNEEKNSVSNDKSDTTKEESKTKDSKVENPKIIAVKELNKIIYDKYEKDNAPPKPFDPAVKQRKERRAARKAAKKAAKLQESEQINTFNENNNKDLENIRFFP